VSRDLIEVNVRAGEVAFDLLAWDKYRSTGERDPADALGTKRLIDRGAACFGRLISTVHGEREIKSLRESEEWLEESKARWLGRPEMTERGSFLKGRRLRVTDEDTSRLDRVHARSELLRHRPCPGGGPGSRRPPRTRRHRSARAPWHPPRRGPSHRGGVPRRQGPRARRDCASDARVVTTMDPIGRPLNAEERSVLIVLTQDGRSAHDRTTVGVALAFERDVVDVAGALTRLKKDGLTSTSVESQGEQSWHATNAAVEAL
jgi:hypothetical protein